MQLNKKKELAKKVLGVGKGRIFFVKENLNEIKEAITRQDILDLYKSGAIRIKEIKGRLKIQKRKHKRGPGKIRKKIKNRKRVYVILTRKLRGVLKHLLLTKRINNEKYKKARKMISDRKFKSKRHLNESLGTI